MSVSAKDRYHQKQRILAAIAAFFGVISIVFVCLYFSKASENQTAYERVFEKAVGNVVSLMEEVGEDSFEYEVKYRQITGELGVCANMAYLADFSDEKKLVWNEVYYAAIKLPDQIELYQAELLTSFRNIVNGAEQEGYHQLTATIEKLDRLDYGEVLKNDEV